MWREAGSPGRTGYSLTLGGIDRSGQILELCSGWEMQDTVTDCTCEMKEMVNSSFLGCVFHGWRSHSLQCSAEHGEG